MILDINYSNDARYKIFDCRRNQIGWVKKYNTQTKEITTCIPCCLGDIRIVCYAEVNDQFLPKVITYILEGSYAEDLKGNRVV